MSGDVHVTSGAKITTCDSQQASQPASVYLEPVETQPDAGLSDGSQHRAVQKSDKFIGK